MIPKIEDKITENIKSNKIAKNNCTGCNSKTINTKFDQYKIFNRLLNH
ncbi:hypothetical protein LDVICp170 [lymphocystis disease virus-China]|uniref:Uncharacterized protein n=1 Tax=lymphocystis disease virus-China TaxID=256729 RepID=Q677U2_9VIRU|nr:hypothetical protein LDVICp170 [lymphocystis disease virus-China]AAU11015.1 hypothetical protein [lymphocystis disease virus-China]